MDPPIVAKALFFAAIFLLSLSQARSSRSAVFIDSTVRPYFRSPHPAEYDSLSSSDVAATVSILLGSAPSASLSAESSKKINELLVPNPFRKPRAVFILDLQQCTDQSLLENNSTYQLGDTFIRKDLQDSDQMEIQISDEDDVVVSSLKNQYDINGDSTSSDETLVDLIKFLGASYSSEELKIPFPDGSYLILHMNKKADSEYLSSLLSLLHHLRTPWNEDTSISTQQSALFTGSFKGLKVLQEEYGKSDKLERGIKIFFKALAKNFNSLQHVYGGDLVGIILFDNDSAYEKVSSIKVHGGGFRLLEETSAENATAAAAAAEQKLVRRTLAWITGLILLISTLIGIYLLLNMPLTKDTLLYSNVKLD